MRGRGVEVPQALCSFIGNFAYGELLKKEPAEMGRLSKQKT